MSIELDSIGFEGIPIVEFNEEESQRSYYQARERPLSSKVYENLHSIDWTHEYERAKSYTEISNAIQPRWELWLRQWSRWLILAGTGLLIGGSTALLDYSYKWLSDLKRGYCTDNFFSNFNSCCSEGDIGDVCESWRSWGDVIGLYGVGSSLYKFTLFWITSLILAFIAAMIVKDTKFVRNSGIAEIKAVINGLVLKDFLTPKLLIVKWLGLLLMVSSGAWVGKEGPLVHISCAASTLFMRLFPIWNENEAKKREILVAASAAGIAVAFNTPIGGVLFTLEQLTSYFNPSDKMWTSFVCSMVGIVTLNFFKEGIDAYVTMENQWLSFELIGFILLGILGGCYGHLFNKLNIKFANFRETYITPKGSNYEVLEILILSIVTSVITYPLVFPRLPLSSLIGILYQDCNSENVGSLSGLCEENSNSAFLLILTGITGVLLTAYTFGTIIPAGILMPSLVIGGIFGRLLGMFMELIQAKSGYLSELCSNSEELCISPGAYAVIGSAAFLTGVTKMTVWVVVTVFELTGALTYVLPIMITVLIARLVSDLVTEYNCYDLWIQFLNYPYLHDSNKALPMVKINKYIKSKNDLQLIYLEDIIRLKDLEKYLDFKFQGLPILKSIKKPILIGWLPLDDLKEEINFLKGSLNGYDSERRVVLFKGETSADSIDLSNLVERNYLTLNPDLELPTLIEIFYKLKPRFVLFAQDGLFTGLLTLKDVTKISETIDE